MKKGPYLMGIFCSDMQDAITLVNQFYMADQVVQIIPDSHPAGGFWLMLAVTGDQKNLLIEYGQKQRPRWSIR